jgi:hypothetical protein
MPEASRDRRFAVRGGRTRLWGLGCQSPRIRITRSGRPRTAPQTPPRGGDRADRRSVRRVEWSADPGMAAGCPDPLRALQRWASRGYPHKTSRYNRSWSGRPIRRHARASPRSQPEPFAPLIPPACPLASGLCMDMTTSTACIDGQHASSTAYDREPRDLPQSTSQAAWPLPRFTPAC